MERKVRPKKPRNILATDLDGTLVGNRMALAEFNRYMLKNISNFLLVYVTGRTFSSAWRLILEENLLFPDVLITDVGTEIYLSPRFKHDPIWEKKMSSSWDAGKIRAVIDNVGGLHSQEIYPRFRLAYCTDKAAFKDIALKLSLAVEMAKLPVKVVPSMGHIIDIIPKDAGKGPALCYVREMYSIKKEHTFVCGDSGNDLSMFLRGFKGIVVGNARPELKQAIKLKSREVYFSKSFYASGILEGLKKYGMV
ncbi:MAG: HAD-IIB family hydrolase [Pelotomaculum sp.]|nr:HAD-IIB family hydrolase [Pelotomaculum sp.]